MQISATLIAAQQAAREAQSRFQTAHFTPAKAGEASFSAALEKEDFQPLKLQQTATPAAAATPDAASASRPGSLLDIRI